MADVFISYKAEEFNEANWVKTTLETNGISCWMAPMSIPGGSNYALEIPQAIRSSGVFVLILSERCQLSRWVPRELDQAINEGKTILPFMLEDCPLKDDFNFYLSNVQRYAAYESKSAAIEKMINEIRAILGVPKQEAVPAQPEERPDGSGGPVPASHEVPCAPVTSQAPAVPNDAAAAPAEAALPKREKKPENERPNAEGKKKKPKTALLIVLAALLTVLAVVLAAVFIGKANTVSVAGEKFNRNDSSIKIEGKELSEEDIAELSRFRSLSSLRLIDCKLPDGALNGLFALPGYLLELNNCGVTDDQLSAADLGAVTVKELILDNNGSLSDPAPIALLGETLLELSLNNCSVTDLSFLKDFSVLRSLSAEGNRIGSLEGLSGCPKLESVNVNDNAVGTLEGIENCISLQKLYARGNGIEDLSGIKNATLLSDVDLSGNKICDISLLSKSLKHLSAVDLSDNDISDIGPLDGAEAIISLNVSNNRIASLDPLSKSGEMTRLNAAHNQLTQFDGSIFQKLIELDLSYNEIGEIGSLAFNENAYSVSLDLSHNKIGSVDLPEVKYKYLAVYGNPDFPVSEMGGVGGSTFVFDYTEKIDFDKVGDSDFNEYVIFDCPLDKQIEIGDTLGEYRVIFTSEEEYFKED